MNFDALLTQCAGGSRLGIIRRFLVGLRRIHAEGIIRRTVASRAAIREARAQHGKQRAADGLAGQAINGQRAAANRRGNALRTADIYIGSIRHFMFPFAGHDFNYRSSTGCALMRMR